MVGHRPCLPWPCGVSVMILVDSSCPGGGRLVESACDNGLSSVDGRSPRFGLHLPLLRHRWLFQDKSHMWLIKTVLLKEKQDQ